MGPRNQTQSVKNSLNAFSTEIASCIWARFTQKSSSQTLAKKKWKTLFNNYKAKLSGQMVKSLGKSIINMYSMGPCSVLRIRNQEALSNNASTSTPMAIPIATSMETIVIPCSLNRVLIFSPNEVSLSNTLAIVSRKLVI